ncbi:hypothetical protein RJ639_026586 [Escallonia herrerae]|uniref:Reverse transcriptase/retrotransposon-derived protein RNase H-like domain-containing protein n=1 Tax=Escallonia herrerae TaxID=1293975 RepID=A0AA89ACZ2_9ASTE|nr:hypothetical protein RJ639_026586 [Escallonia herrerae]
MASCRNRANETLVIEDLRDETKVERGKPAEDLFDIQLYPGNQEKIVRVGIGLSNDLKLKLVDLLRSYSYIFAWTASDMPGIDPEAIRKAKDFEWTEECQKSFEKLKRYLSSPSLLTKPVTGEDLFLYLSISEVAVSTVLIREEEGKQRPIYYISKVLQDVETRYPRIDKVALALVTSARKLRPYFQSHTIVVLTDQPLGKVLQNPDASGRLVNWSVELGEFDIKYQPRTAIKAQALSDFVVECTIPEDPQQLILSEVLDPWLLYVDGSSKRKLDDAKGAWVDELPKVLWAYRTTPHSVTGETPFLLCFRTEALLPVEVGLPTVRVLQFSEAENEENLRGNLDLLDDVRAQALDRMISTKQRVARFYNRRVRMRIFRVGDLVLRKLEVSDPKATGGKLSPNWEGPYKISKVLRPGAYSLETLSGEAIPRTWNADNLRQYYQSIPRSDTLLPGRNSIPSFSRHGRFTRWRLKAGHHNVVQEKVRILGHQALLKDGKPIFSPLPEPFITSCTIKECMDGLVLDLRLFMPQLLTSFFQTTKLGKQISILRLEPCLRLLSCQSQHYGPRPSPSEPILHLAAIAVCMKRLLECRNPSRKGRRQRILFQKLDYAFFGHLVPLLICSEPSVFIKFILGFILDFPKGVSMAKRSAGLENLKIDQRYIVGPCIWEGDFDCPYPSPNYGL